MRRVLWLWLVGLWVLAVLEPCSAWAHEIRPTLLDIREVGHGSYRVAWKRPVSYGVAVPVTPRFPAQCGRRALPTTRGGDFWVDHFQLSCLRPLAGEVIVFEGLSGTMFDGLVRIDFLSGRYASGVVRPTQPTFVVPAARSTREIVRQYASLGIEHILRGYDHLLFLLALSLCLGDFRRIPFAATAFTLGHSLTLSAAVLGFVWLPSRLIEAVIALSIVALAAELVQRGRPLKPATQFPLPLLAGGFGLLHGMGFASALSEIGLPSEEVPLALFAFNLGVEVGQLAFIAALVAVGLLAMRLNAPILERARLATAYGIGSVSAFWTIQRVAGF